MKLITQRDKIREVSQSWDRQYPPKIETQADKIIIGNQLRALNLDKATARDIFNIIGNSSWTDLRCAECGKSVTAIMQLGEEPDYESATTWVCKSCITKAYKLFNGGKYE